MIPFCLAQACPRRRGADGFRQKFAVAQFQQTHSKELAVAPAKLKAADTVASEEPEVAVARAELNAAVQQVPAQQVRRFPLERLKKTNSLLSCQG